jgi:hypothetical protein
MLDLDGQTKRSGRVTQSLGAFISAHSSKTFCNEKHAATKTSISYRKRSG